MSMYSVDPDFQTRLAAWNASHGGPSRIALSWHPKKNRWQVFAIPTQDSSHPLARNDVTAKLLMNFPDGSGRQGILLNTWQGAKGEFLPLDERLFEALNYADSFRDREHYENTIKRPEMQAEASTSKRTRDILSAGYEYWRALDSLTLNMNARASGNWRRGKGMIQP